MRQTSRNVRIHAPVNGSNQKIMPHLGRLGDKSFNFSQAGGITSGLVGQIHHDEVLLPIYVQRQDLEFVISSQYPSAGHGVTDHAVNLFTTLKALGFASRWMSPGRRGGLYTKLLSG